MTPAQLDAIATKLLGWKVCRSLSGASEYFEPSTRSVFGHLGPASRHDAMLVLEAMGKAHDVRLETACRQWKCRATGDNYSFAELGDTPAQAIFACAAKLVERM